MCVVGDELGAAMNIAAYATAAGAATGADGITYLRTGGGNVRVADAAGGITYLRTGGEYVRVRNAAAGGDAAGGDAAAAGAAAAASDTAAAGAPTRSLSLCKFYAKLCVPCEAAGE